jgi:hypothetical protein
MTTPAFRTVPIPTALAEAARRERRSPQYGHPTHTEVAPSYGPCRLCLDTFRVGAEERLLFTYDPFAGLDPYPAPGPIFVHADGCEPFDGGPGVLSEQVAGRVLSVRAYDADAMMTEAAVVEGERFAERVSALLDDPDVAFLHAHFAGPGCFAFRVDRS